MLARSEGDRVSWGMCRWLSYSNWHSTPNGPPVPDLWRPGVQRVRGGRNPCAGPPWMLDPSPDVLVPRGGERTAYVPARSARENLFDRRPRQVRAFHAEVVDT